MTRILLSLGACLLALALGLIVAHLAARNRARARDLDQRHHRCETLARQNELLRVGNGRLEWLVLQGREGDLGDVDASLETHSQPALQN